MIPRKPGGSRGAADGVRRGPRTSARLRAARRNLAAAHIVVEARAAGLCERCGDPLTFGVTYHHRQPRSMGGSSRSDRFYSAANLLALCVYPGKDCHRLIESYRARAIELGYLVPQSSDFRETPVLYRGCWVRLTDDGGLTACPDGSTLSFDNEGNLS